MENKTNTPEKKYKSGGVTASIFKNTVKDKKSGEETEYSTVVLERCYKDKDGNWQNTNSFRLNDLPKAALVLNQAYQQLSLKDVSMDYMAAEAATEQDII